VVNTAAAWSERAETLATPHEACGWTATSQADRMRKVVSALNPQPGDSLLDFGCGTGELARYIDGDVGYIGYDSAQGMVIRAAREHPDHHFQMSEPLGQVDLVAVVGTFNLPGDKLLTWAALRRLWDATGRTLAASLYAGGDERCLVYTEAECVRFASGEAYHWHVERWRHNDLLIVLDRGPRKRVF
jgi:predicted TPR repeat methyltransferase